ncbi:MAG: alcohol dehydrogenase catalytic domain-containing protein, partial [Bifidobacteriaceae bacterium]|nr:alcohol dehydrogenase catalytic domain-containing protein [Bifidobacteriaceae bacterium]
MKALVYHGPGKKAWEEVPDPTIQDPNDVIVQIDTTTICGSDLHILKGDVPAVQDGRVLGHEGVGTVVEVGSGVAKFEVGHRVVINCITTCGTCAFCRVGHPSH